MPAYSQLLPPVALDRQYPCNQQIVFNAEAVTTGEYSQQVSIPNSMSGETRAIRVELDFSADPGNFEVDIMEADTDTFTGTAGTGPQSNYQQVPLGGSLTQANKTTGANGANTHVGSDLIPFAGQFALLYVKLQPSNAAIKVTARITRAA